MICFNHRIKIVRYVLKVMVKVFVVAGGWDIILKVFSIIGPKSIHVNTFEILYSGIFFSEVGRIPQRKRNSSENGNQLAQERICVQSCCFFIENFLKQIVHIWKKIKTSIDRIWSSNQRTIREIAKLQVDGFSRTV